MKLGLVAHACNPNSWEADTGESLQVQGQPDVHSSVLSHFKMKLVSATGDSCNMHTKCLLDTCVLYSKGQMQKTTSAQRL